MKAVLAFLCLRARALSRELQFGEFSSSEEKQSISTLTELIWKISITIMDH